jgi:heme-degrading monooxygenase HmoA
MSQTTLISFFKYKVFKNKWNAFVRMGRPPISLKNIEGLTFFKPLGTGSGNGFSIKPDFSTYGFVLVFSSEEKAAQFLQSSTFKKYQKNAEKYATVFMKTIKSHGEWSKQNPFKSEVEFDKSKPLAVITRATIKPKLAHKFWKYVPSVSKSMNNYDSLVFSKGIGEFPLLMQATFSLWESAEAMMDYAYKNPKHAEMVKKTRELGWYSEELFARFQPYKIEGNLIPNFF